MKGQQFGMHQAWRITTLILSTALLTACSKHKSDEPSYAGKTVNQWLNAGYEDSAMGLQNIGVAAAPYVLARLSREDPRYGTARHYREFWRRLPSLVKAIFPSPRPATFDQLRATSTLLELGPSIIPLLSSKLDDLNPAVRMVCARTLAGLRQQGCNIGKAKPALVRATHDSNPKVAAMAASALAGRFTAVIPQD
jgi:hypothetical protein